MYEVYFGGVTLRKNLSALAAEKMVHRLNLGIVWLATILGVLIFVR
jgi:hypothetical protein